MKKEELMIGNLIKINGIVVTIDERTIFDFDHDKIVKEPIPITEEWLLRFGFFKYNNAYVLEKPSENIMNFKFSIWNDFTYNSSEFPVELKSVHQLQNLYFCLCGTHLTLK